ncbi:MAG TPA: PEP-CTERM sorting domain-containing protein [Candidatus Acidoferrum sp.]|nr:PEP-CTERM sorting domain-containing protein [Candidatus Acidoferrum sp.]
MTKQTRMVRLTTAAQDRPAAVPRRLIPLGALLLLCTTAQAGVLFQDGFDYAAGANLYGSGGNWNGSSGVNSTAITVSNANLSWTGLADLPGADSASVASLNAGGQQNAATFASQTLAGGGAVYASFLLDYTSLLNGYNQNYTLAGLLPTGASYSSTGDPCDLAIQSLSKDGTYFNLGIRTANGVGAVYGSTPVTLLTNTINFIVIKYDFSTKKASVYIDPTSLGGDDPQTPNVITGVNTGTANDLSQFYIRAGGNALVSPNINAPFLIDDVRVGTTWADVTPVPEPSTLAMMGLGGMALGFWRRLFR